MVENVKLLPTPLTQTPSSEAPPTTILNESEPTSSETAGLLSPQSNVPVLVKNGNDVKGNIGGADAEGRGQILIGGKGSGDTEGIQVRYTSDDLPKGAVSSIGNFANSPSFTICLAPPSPSSAG